MLKQRNSMKKKHELMDLDEYLKLAIPLMVDPQKIEFAEDFIKNRLVVVKDDDSKEINLDKISVKALTFFIYTLIEDWESTSK